eukprot:5274525-Prymnesium_polylepis.1
MPKEPAADDLVCAYLLRHAAPQLVDAATAGHAFARRFFCEAAFVDLVEDEKHVTALDYLRAFVPDGQPTGTAEGPSAWWQLAYALGDWALRAAMARGDMRRAIDSWNRLASLHPGGRTHRRMLTLDKVLKGECSVDDLPPPSSRDALAALLRQ